MPLTKEQFKKAIDAGFSVEEIVKFENRKAGIYDTAPEPKSGVNVPLETLKGTAGTIGKSGGRLIGNVAQAALHPIKTAKSLGGLAVGTVQKAIPGRQAQEHFPEAVGGFLKERYGGTEKIAETVATDPLGFAFDAYTAGAGVGGILKGAGKLTGLKSLEKAGSFPMTTNALKSVRQGISKKLPKVMGDNWFVQQANNAKNVVTEIRGTLSNAYNKIYNKVNKVGVDSSKIDDILLNSNVDDVVLTDIQNLVGARVNTVEKAKMVSDILQKRTPQSFYLSGGTTGKGGLASPKIRQMSAYRAVKEVIDDSISQVDPAAGAQLKSLNSFAHKKVYPTLDQMDSIVGKKVFPKTTGIESTYKLTSIGKAAERTAIRGIPKMSKEFKNYITKDFAKDLTNLTKDSKQLIKDMNKYRKRQTIKGVGIGIGATAGTIGGIQYMGRILSGER